MRKKQEGVVLLVSLILLLATSFIGFSIMETSSLEAKMAASKQGKEESFQASESIIDLVAGNQGMMGQARNKALAGNKLDTVDYAFGYDAKMKGSAELTFIGDSIAYGEDWNRGLKNQFFQIRSYAERAGPAFETQHMQGLRMKAPTL